jgi:6-phosphogluconolactonase
MKQRYCLVGALATATFLAACGGTSNGLAPSTSSEVQSGAGTGEFIYVANSDLDGSSSGPYSVSAYAANATSGALTQVAGSPFAAGNGPLSLAIDPNGTFVYVANVDSGNVSAYSISPTSGALTPVYGSPFAAGSGPTGVAINPQGTFVYVANYYSENIFAYSINPTSGALAPVYGSPFAAGSNPVGVAVDRKGRFVYVTDYYGDRVYAYSINPTSGALTPLARSPFRAGAAPFGIAVDPKGNFAYVTNSASDASGNVSAFKIQAGGALIPVPGSPFGGGGSPYGIAVDPKGAFVYVANDASANVFGTVSAYAINATSGALTPVVGSPFVAGTQPVGVAVDPTGKFAYVTNEGYNGSGNVSAYTINPTSGALTTVYGSPFGAGLVPFGIATCRVKSGTCKPPPL